MAFSVRDEATDRAVRRLAEFKNQTLTETIREAVELEYERVRKETPMVERLDRIMRKYNRFPASDVIADKAFFDDLSGEA